MDLVSNFPSLNFLLLSYLSSSPPQIPTRIFFSLLETFSIPQIQQPWQMTQTCAMSYQTCSNVLTSSPMRWGHHTSVTSCYVKVMAYRHDCTHTRLLVTCHVTRVQSYAYKCLRECRWHKCPRMCSRVWVCPCLSGGICHSFRVCVFPQTSE